MPAVTPHHTRDPEPRPLLVSLVLAGVGVDLLLATLACRAGPLATQLAAMLAAKYLLAAGAALLAVRLRRLLLRARQACLEELQD